MKSAVKAETETLFEKFRSEMKEDEITVTTTAATEIANKKADLKRTNDLWMEAFAQ
jgi:hypothetical protein